MGRELSAVHFFASSLTVPRPHNIVPSPARLIWYGSRAHNNCLDHVLLVLVSQLLARQQKRNNHIAPLLVCRYEFFPKATMASDYF